MFFSLILFIVFSLLARSHSDFFKGFGQNSEHRFIQVIYLDGKGDDGVVPLQSQSPLKLQAESARIYVFNNEHSEILRDTDFFPVFNKILTDGRTK